MKYRVVLEPQRGRLHHLRASPARLRLTGRDGRGSHMVYFQQETNRTVVVTKHREIKAGTLREILREADLSKEEFRKLLR